MARRPHDEIHVHAAGDDHASHRTLAAHARPPGSRDATMRRNRWERGMARTFLIDTDTASDDAVALLMALRWPEVEVAGITVVAGNMPLERGARNALYTVELCGATVPVYL